MDPVHGKRYWCRARTRESSGGDQGGWEKGEDSVDLS